MTDQAQVTEWRLGALEAKVNELTTRSEGWHNTLAAQITGLSNQIGTTLAALPSMYAPRPEAEERHRSISEHFDALEKQTAAHFDEIERRFKDHGHDAIASELSNLDKRIIERSIYVDDRVSSNLKRIERIELLGWGFVAGLVTTLATALFALMRIQQATGGGP